MCRFVAYLGPPVSVADLVLEPEHSLLRQSWAPRLQRHGTVNADGFGCGWYDHAVRAEPARYRTDRPMWTDRSFASLAAVVRAPAVLAAVRSATPPLPVEESGAPPFTAGPWLFAHNGAIAGYREGAGAALRAGLDERAAGVIEGASDAELLFAVTLGHLYGGASLAAALSATVGTASSAAPGSRLNLVLTDGHTIAATAYGDTLFVARRSTAAGPSVLVVSEPSDDAIDWEPIPDGSVVETDASACTVMPLFARQGSHS
jgi:glutamine amidotransferase